MKKIRGKEIINEYISFGEDLNSEDLSSLRSSRIIDSIQNILEKDLETVIAQFKKDPENFYLLTFLSNNLDNSKNYINNQVLKKEYENKSYAEALSSSIFLAFSTEFYELSFVYAPDNQIVRNNFKNYQLKLREKKKEFIENVLPDFIPFDYKYGNVNDLKKMSKEQLDNRKKMFQVKIENQEKFNEIWENGSFHLATIISRLEKTNFKDTLMMREEILNKNEIRCEIKDYGLTISEIMNMLQNINKNNEKYLYKAFVDANFNLKAILLIIRNIGSIAPEDRFDALKTIQTLVKDPDMRFYYYDMTKYNTVKKIIKKYNLPTHKNYKKD